MPRSPCKACIHLLIDCLNAWFVCSRIPKQANIQQNTQHFTWHILLTMFACACHFRLSNSPWILIESRILGNQASKCAFLITRLLNSGLLRPRSGLFEPLYPQTLDALYSPFVFTPKTSMAEGLGVNVKVDVTLLSLLRKLNNFGLKALLSAGHRP
jgi:hypothetical protein